MRSTAESVHKGLIRLIQIQDSALMRPGRLDRILYVSPPDRSARLDIFNVNFRKMAIHEDVDVNTLSDIVRLV